MLRRLVLASTLCLAAGGCASLLPSDSQVTASPWKSYEDAQVTFDKIVPGLTREDELQGFHLDPSANANIAILHYADVMNRFIPHASISMADLDAGVVECLRAKTQCKAYEVKQRHVQRKRDGGLIVDLLGFHRETETTGWSFNGLILIRKGVVVYKLTGGQPSIRERQEATNPLGPVQGLAQKLIAF